MWEEGLLFLCINEPVSFYISGRDCTTASMMNHSKMFIPTCLNLKSWYLKNIDEKIHVIQSSNLSKTIQHYDIIKTCILYYLFHLNFIKHYIKGLFFKL
jgi:hypothetical protein